MKKPARFLETASHAQENLPINSQVVPKPQRIRTGREQIKAIQTQAADTARLKGQDQTRSGKKKLVSSHPRQLSPRRSDREDGFHIFRRHVLVKHIEQTCPGWQYQRIGLPFQFLQERIRIACDMERR